MVPEAMAASGTIALRKPGDCRSRITLRVSGTTSSLGASPRIGYIARMRDFTDEQLMRRYARGDAQAFDLLYERHRGPLYRYFLRQVSDTATANDLYQGTWEKIIKARRRYRSNAPFTAWMYRIAHNHLADHYRRLRPVEELQESSIADTKTGPAQATLDDEQRQLLHAGIISLPAEQRNTLLLKLETGLKMEDIARVTGVSRETVKSRLRYAVKKLRQDLPE
ncbi:MAG: sigma-70 family RNA polymerase sigma factor [Xanthomonadales bacterium]|nr:sigma-70 family RNA polymerase sigma factor [Xanthomonadales bacterium]